MASTVIGSSITIDGEIQGDEDLQVLGTVKGKIAIKDRLLIDAGATVEADVETGHVTVSGRMTGNIHATERVEIKAEGKMVGDIKAPRILIADGATFKGNVDMDA